MEETIPNIVIINTILPTIVAVNSQEHTSDMYCKVIYLLVKSKAHIVINLKKPKKGFMLGLKYFIGGIIIIFYVKL